MLRRLCSAAVIVICSALGLNAQVGSGTLQGTVKDKKSAEPLPFVSIVLENRGAKVASGQSDFDGNYKISPIEPGTYDVTVSYVGYQPTKVTGVVVNSNKITFQDFDLNSGVELSDVEVIRYKVPLIDKDGGASGTTVTRDQIAKMPTRSASAIATTVAGASTAGTGGGISIRGARSENTYYYIDGVKVPAGAGIGLPKSAIEEVQVITGGVPASYGDVTGGLVNITTRGPSRSFFGGVEYLTSGYKTGPDITDITGLDKYAFNQLEASLSGPLFFKKDSLGNKEKPLLGFFFSGQATDVVDGGPLWGGDLRVKPGVRDQLLSTPYRVVNVAGNPVVRYNSDYLRADDVERIDTRQNARNRSALASGKIDITTTPTINLSVGGSMDLSNNQSFNRNNSLLNAENNTEFHNSTWRTFLRFTQRFNSKEESAEDHGKGGIKNAYYSIQLDYSRFSQKSESESHGDNLFDYGYLGKYTTDRVPTYNQLSGKQTGFMDTQVHFTPSDQNPDAAAFPEQYFSLFPEGSQFYQNFLNVQQNGGLLNGQVPGSVYNLWNNVGGLSNQYSSYQSDQARVSATGAADIGKHAVSIGVEYEQLTQRSYVLAPVGLWTRARALTNFHLRELDRSDSTIVQGPSTEIYTNYSRLVGDDQTVFDYNLRQALGLDPRGKDFIDVDALDPSVFSLDMFSPDELIQDGNGGMINSYYGYDYTGKKLKSRPSFSDFFNDFKLIGNDSSYTRLQAPFQPIYVAGYVMDKFAFDDIIFNVGVRVDRYDANQNVLKDPYLWRPAYKAGDGQVQDLYNGNNPRPSNIGDDYVVYVNNSADPTAIVGYRDGDNWYNAQGETVVDPSVLRQSDGIQPYLVDYNNDPAGSLTGSKLRQEAFEVYNPKVNVMPRIAFSFPISDEAVFFAHYDILTQRPTGFSRLDLLGYAYIENTGNILTNPNLKPTKTIDYELGFQQVLSKSSSLKLSAYYRELRDQIQVRNVAQAWPTTYRTYDNVDFGNVIGFTTTYDLRRTKNVWLRASYTLQFAKGTGSDPNTTLSLINANQPNLRTIFPLSFDQRHRFQGTVDFRYGEGSDYNGPMLFGKKIFQRTGINVVADLGSGTPYSRSSRVYNEGEGSGTYLLDGSLNGANLPWQFNTSLVVDRDIPLVFGKDKGDKAKRTNLNIYLLVSNVFNTQVITNVYRATGAADDDGFLASSEYASYIASKNDPQSYSDLYALKVDSPYNYGAPRTIRLGARFDF
ncbi:MAG: carboxypeptidase regulatory-like domain-containing protein [Flavobacteriales bacterium]|nr:carboxypeptidase regulatory-like domain-containing protein [Flavobacteriales bacterium]